MSLPKVKKPKKFYLIMIGLLCIALVFVYFFISKSTPDNLSAQQPKNKQDGTDRQQVIYQTDDWKIAKNQSRDVEQIIKHLGSAASRESTLDYYGQPSQMYRFSAKHEPMLYALVSPATLEMVWYAATADDNDKTKNISLDYAQRIYYSMSVAGGKSGSQVVSDALSNKTSNKKQVGSFKLLHATCQAYHCRIVLGRL